MVASSNSATLGDRLRIDLRVSHVGGSSLTFEQRVTKCGADNTLIARVFVVTVYVGSDKRLSGSPLGFGMSMVDLMPLHGPRIYKTQPQVWTDLSFRSATAISTSSNM